MPDGLSIGTLPATTPVIADTSVLAGRRWAEPVAPKHAGEAPGSPNPALRLDPALGIVVLQFSDGNGGGTTTIPSQQQLAAYRDGSASMPGEHHASKHTA